MAENNKLEKIKTWANNNIIVVSIVVLVGVLAFLTDGLQKLDYIKSKFLKPDLCKVSKTEYENSLDQVYQQMLLGKRMNLEDAIKIKAILKEAYLKKQLLKDCIEADDEDKVILKLEKIKGNLQNNIELAIGSIGYYEHSSPSELELLKNKILIQCESYQILCDLVHCSNDEITLLNHTINEYSK